jgi:uncharacterized protein
VAINTFTTDGNSGRPAGSLYPFGELGEDVPRGTGRSKAYKSIFDPVHGPIRLDGAALALVQTPEFQRLWGIRQTGFAHLVFPGANHTRLEHSLGTYWVAGQMASHLGLGAADTLRVTVGALLHDLGHGPFSHTLDSPMTEVLGHGHERISRERIQGTDRAWPADRVEVPTVLERHGIDPRAVADLVDPRPIPRPRPMFRQILHGAIDADRIDYLQRDAYYTGVGHGAIDAVRLLDTVRAVRGRLVFAEKGRSAVEGFLVGRALMYSSVYYHKTVRAAEMMAQAAVERMPGYPEAARDLFQTNDGGLLFRLREAGGLSASLVEGLLARRLYKRSFGLKTVRGAARSAWERRLRVPVERRAVEDQVARAVHAPEGSVLIDLAALKPREGPEDDWASVGLLVGNRTTYPFRRPSPWYSLASRPPAEWAVTVFAASRWAAAVGKYFSRLRPMTP